MYRRVFYWTCLWLVPNRLQKMNSGLPSLFYRRFLHFHPCDMNLPSMLLQLSHPPSWASCAHAVDCEICQQKWIEYKSEGNVEHSASLQTLYFTRAVKKMPTILDTITHVCSGYIPKALVLGNPWDIKWSTNTSKWSRSRGTTAAQPVPHVSCAAVRPSFATPFPVKMITNQTLFCTSTYGTDKYGSSFWYDALNISSWKAATLVLAPKAINASEQTWVKANGRIENRNERNGESMTWQETGGCKFEKVQHIDKR